MATSKQSILETRRDQIFPVLEPVEIERIRRFGTPKSYRSGQMLAEAGKTLEGLTVILSGTVSVARHTPSGEGLRRLANSLESTRPTPRIRHVSFVLATKQHERSNR